MKTEKTYTIEEVKEHGKEFIAEQAGILRKNLKKSEGKKEEFHYV